MKWLQNSKVPYSGKTRSSRRQNFFCLFWRRDIFPKSSPAEFPLGLRSQWPGLWEPFKPEALPRRAPGVPTAADWKWGLTARIEPPAGRGEDSWTKSLFGYQGSGLLVLNMQQGLIFGARIFLVLFYAKGFTWILLLNPYSKLMRVKWEHFYSHLTHDEPEEQRC